MRKLPNAGLETISKTRRDLFPEGDARKEMATVIKVAGVLRPTGSGGLDTAN